MKKNDSTISSPTKEPVLFVTYAREDVEFRKKLVERLREQGLSPTGDWNLTPGPEYSPQLDQMIETAEVYAFFMSNQSVDSKNCLSELHIAAKLGKKIIPVLVSELNPEFTLHETLQKPQWSIFQNDYELLALDINRAVHTDFALTLLHTRFTIAAKEKYENNGPTLSGRNLRQAIKMKADLIKSRYPYPALTPLLDNFIRDSLHSKRVRMGLGFCAVSIACALVFALYTQVQNTQLEQEKAKQEGAYKLSFASRNLLQEDPRNLMLSLLLSIEAMKKNPSVEADIALRKALAAAPRLIARVHNGEEMEKLAFVSDGNYLVGLTHENQFFVWDTHTWKPLDILQGIAVKGFEVSSKYLIVFAKNSIIVIDAQNLKMANAVQINTEIKDLLISTNSKFIALNCDTLPETRIFTLPELSPGRIIHHPTFYSDMSFSEDDGSLAVAYYHEIILWKVLGDGMRKLPAMDRIVARNIDWARVAGNSVLAYDGDFSEFDLSTSQAWSTSASSLFEYQRLDPLASIAAFVLSPSRQFGVAQSDKEISLYEVRDIGIRKKKWSFPNTGKQSLGHVTFNSDESVVAWYGNDNVVYVLDTQSGNLLSQFGYDGAVISYETDRRLPITAMALSPDGKSIAIATQNYDSISASGNPTFVLETRGYKTHFSTEHYDAVRSMAFDSTSEYFISGDEDGYIQSVRLAESKELRTFNLKSTTKHIESVAFGNSGNTLAAGCDDNRVYIWNDWKHTTGDTLTLQHNGGIQKIMFQGTKLVTASNDSFVRVWDIPSRTVLSKLPHYSRFVDDFEISSKHKIIATVADSAHLWSFPEGHKICSLPHRESISDVCFDQNSQYVATACVDGTVGLWEATTGKNLFFTSPENRQINRVTFSPNSDLLAAASGDWGGRRGGDMTRGKILLWRVPSMEVFRAIEHPFTVYAVAFSPDGQVIASTSADRFIRIWDVKTGNELSRIPLYDVSFTIAFSPDGKYVAVPGQIFLWKDTDMLNEAQRHVTRKLTATEQIQYLSK